MTDRNDVGGGLLDASAIGFRKELERLGYTDPQAQLHMALLAHLSAWLHEERISPNAVTSERIAEFLQTRKALPLPRLVSLVGAGPLLRYLRRLGLIPEPSRPTPSGPIDDLVERYHEYLVSQRGICPMAAVYYERVARLFLHDVREGDVFDLATVTADEVSRFVIRFCVKPTYVSPPHMVSAMRSFLRFLNVEGITGLALAQAVPSYANWRMSSIPKALTLRDVSLLLDSCDRRRAIGRRDYAMLALLSRLGLRAGEVATLSLDDIDWRAGEVVVHGKGPRDERLPLPADVGEAIVGYLRRGRPRTDNRAVFIRGRAPVRPLSPSGVSRVVYKACTRAGIARVGAHVLRHTAATQMLRNGASLTEIGQVLRHRRVDTTAIYAKVDHAALAGLARPWPGGVA
jgi:integrase/recombinase XerD